MSQHSSPQYSPSADLPLILASASPRRRELLALLGLPFSVHTSDVEERGDLAPVPAPILAALPPCPVPLDDHPTLRAWRKVADVQAQRNHAPAVLLGADTVVVLAGQVLNKPDNPDHAHWMLRQLSGKVHTVYTGVCVAAPTVADSPATPFGMQLALSVSDVTIAPLDDAMIEAYIATGEPRDKAGAYGIQGLGGRLVQQVQGSYSGVIGLPLGIVQSLLTHAGMPPVYEPLAALQQWLEQQGKDPHACLSALP